MSDKTIPADEAFTEEDIEFSSDLHELVNKIIIQLKEEEFARDDAVIPYEKQDRLHAYGRVVKHLVAFSDRLNKYVFKEIFGSETPDLDDFTEPVNDESKCCNGGESYHEVDPEVAKTSSFNHAREDEPPHHEVTES